MKPKWLSLILSTVFLVLVVLAALPDQLLGGWLPAEQIPRLTIYKAVFFTLLLTAAIYAWTFTFRQEFKKVEAKYENAEKESLRQASYLDALSRTSLEMNLKTDPTSALDFICREMLSALKIHAAALMLYRSQNDEMELVSAYGLPKEFNQGFSPVLLTANRERLSINTDPLVLKDTDDEFADLPNSQMFARLGFSALARLTLSHGDEFLGELVVIQYGEGDEFSADQLSLLKVFGNQLSILLANTGLLTEARENLRKFNALRTADIAILSSLDLNLTLKIFLREVGSELQAAAVDVLLFKRATQSLEYAAGLGFQTGKIKESRIQLGEGHAGKIAVERRSIYLSNIRQDDHFTRRHMIETEGFAAYFGIPLIAKGQLQGVLEVFHRSPFYPQDKWLSFLETLAGQAAIAIDNASLYSNLQQLNMDLTIAYDRTLEGWSRALDLRDHETEGHTLRVTQLVIQLAQDLGVNEEELVHIRRGALLHDIGKIGVPDQILHKPSGLTDDEFRIIQTHPVTAFEMLSPINYLRPAIDIPYCHHEKWDGSGYPRGLKGDVIPLAARIFAVVDVWDALISNRPYRAALSHDDAAQHIRQQTGTHFDPKVVNVFLRIMDGNVS